MTVDELSCFAFCTPWWAVICTTCMTHCCDIRSPYISFCNKLITLLQCSEIIKYTAYQKKIQVCGMFLNVTVDTRWQSVSPQHEVLFLISPLLSRENELISILSWCAVCACRRCGTWRSNSGERKRQLSPCILLPSRSTVSHQHHGQSPELKTDSKPLGAALIWCIQNLSTCTSC